MLKKFNFKKNIIIALLIILAVAFTIQSISANNEFFSLGRKIKDMYDTEKNRVLASVNDASITQHDLDRAYIIHKHLYELQEKEFKKIKYKGTFTGEELDYMKPKLKTKGEVLQELVEKEMLYLESIEEGCVVSDEEVKCYIEEQKKIYQDILDGKVEAANNEEAIIGIKQVEQFAEGMGLTVEKYWEYMEHSIKKDLSISRLKNKVLQQLSDTERLDYKKSTQTINKYVQTLYKKYRIKINGNYPEQ